MTRWITLLALLALAAGARAQGGGPTNTVGLYMVEDPDGCATAQVDAPAGTTFTCYMVLTNPWNENVERPVSVVSGFEFRLGLPSDLVLVDAWEPPLNTGDGALPEFIYAVNLPVVDGRCRLMYFRIMSMTDEPRFLSLGPVQDAPVSIPGRMAYVDDMDGAMVWPDNLVGMDPVSGSPDVPVFAVNWDGALSFCETVPDEGISFGAVKALYR